MSQLSSAAQGKTTLQTVLLHVTAQKHCCACAGKADALEVTLQLSNAA
jgi:hypothetical protein